MVLKSKLFYVLSVAALMTVAPMSEALGTTIATAWREERIDRQTCLGRARDVLYRTGFRENVQEVGGESVFATSGNFMASVRCLSDRSLVFFAVAGPNAGVSDMVTNVRFYF
ncbi:MAG: hypothetical protein SWY16_00575 [Cyanobacteriota bacterium]|nr:hypothetical protein [Cyanobacteriota bacterium]